MPGQRVRDVDLPKGIAVPEGGRSDVRHPLAKIKRRELFAAVERFFPDLPDRIGHMELRQRLAVDEGTIADRANRIAVTAFSIPDARRNRKRCRGCRYTGDFGFICLFSFLLFQKSEIRPLALHVVDGADGGGGVVVDADVVNGEVLADEAHGVVPLAALREGCIRDLPNRRGRDRKNIASSVSDTRRHSMSVLSETEISAHPSWSARRRPFG